MLSRPDWLVVKSPVIELSFPTLDASESSAISLALELNATLIIDEQIGRTIAKSNGLKVIGAIGVLEQAALNGHIPDLGLVFDVIRTMNFHISDSLLVESLARVQKSKHT
jgi:predicted nucleic acid-binding protein